MSNITEQHYFRIVTLKIANSTKVAFETTSVIESRQYRLMKSCFKEQSDHRTIHNFNTKRKPDCIKKAPRRVLQIILCSFLELWPAAAGACTRLNEPGI
jgi:hypothetical protein